MIEVQKFFLQHSWAVAMLVTAVLSAWRLPTVRDQVFAWIPRLPVRVQWAAPLCIAMLAAAGQGYLDGARGEALLLFALAQGGQIGVEAIGFWHFYKRVRGTRIAPLAAAIAVLFLLPITIGCAALPWAHSTYDDWRAACGKDLSARQDVAVNAQLKGLDVGDFAEAICELSDVVAPFARASETPANRQLVSPGDEAVAAARRIGVMQ